MTADDETFTFKVEGTGMKSVFRTGDAVRVRRVPPEELLPGDIIVFITRWGGPDRPKRLAIHRLMAKKRGKDGEWSLYARPESRWRLNAPIPAASVLGKVVAVSRDGLSWTEVSELSRNAPERRPGTARDSRAGAREKIGRPWPRPARP